MLDFSFPINNQLIQAQSDLERYEREYSLVSYRWWKIVKQVWEDCVGSNDKIIIFGEVLDHLDRWETYIHIHKESLKLPKRCQIRVREILESLWYEDIDIQLKVSNITWDVDTHVYFSVENARKKFNEKLVSITS